MAYLVKTPRLVSWWHQTLLWKVDTTDKVLYLTFDDGPTPEITPWVLDTLATNNAKATFFCIGENAQKHPKILARIEAEGHAVGNHTHNHWNGWYTRTDNYVKNVADCGEVISSKLFRPPYGRIRRKQANTLLLQYRIVMWDVLSGDFDIGISPKDCAEHVQTQAEEGSIVVFHDSVKAAERMQHALPRVLQYFSQKGYHFKSLAD